MNSTMMPEPSMARVYRRARIEGAEWREWFMVRGHGRAVLREKVTQEIKRQFPDMPRRGRPLIKIEYL